MKIYKRPDCLIFDTENPDQIIFKDLNISELTPLHQVIDDTVWIFITKNFQPSKRQSNLTTSVTIHPILSDFTKSYYYQVKD